jgi:hypothetical protein
MGSPGAVKMIVVRHEYLKVDTAVKTGQKHVAQTLLSVPAFITITIEHRQEACATKIQIAFQADAETRIVDCFHAIRHPFISPA